MCNPKLFRHPGIGRGPRVSLLAGAFTSSRTMTSIWRVRTDFTKGMMALDEMRASKAEFMVTAFKKNNKFYFKK